MKPELKDKIAIYRPHAKMDEVYSKKIGSQLNSSGVTLKSMGLKAILFSLKGAEIVDYSSIEYISDALEYLQDSLEVETGFIDYDESFFKKIKEQLNDSKLGLYKNYEIASTIIGSEKSSRFNNIVIWDENQLLSELLHQELVARGYKVITVNSKGEFETMSKKHSPDTLFISHTYIDLSSSFIPTKVQNGAVIYELQANLNKKVESNFNFAGHQKRIKEGFKLFIFDAKNVKQANHTIFDFFISLSLQSLKIGAKIALVNLSKNLLPMVIKAKIEKGGILTFDNFKSLWEEPSIKKITNQTEAPKGLTKKLVASLPTFIDASLETFESLTGLKATKKSHKISTCILNVQEKIVSASLKFQGELNGHLVVIFNEPLIRKLADTLLGESNCSLEELLDTASEFANIIGGKSKALLSQKDQHITIAIPKTFDTLQKLSTFLEDRNGIEIELDIDGNHMTIFLTY